jgi:hypothetical protein
MVPDCLRDGSLWRLQFVEFAHAFSTLCVNGYRWSGPEHPPIAGHADDMRRFAQSLCNQCFALYLLYMCTKMDLLSAAIRGLQLGNGRLFGIYVHVQRFSRHPLNHVKVLLNATRHHEKSGTGGRLRFVRVVAWVMAPRFTCDYASACLNLDPEVPANAVPAH